MTATHKLILQGSTIAFVAFFMGLWSGKQLVLREINTQFEMEKQKMVQMFDWGKKR